MWHNIFHMKVKLALQLMMLQWENFRVIKVKPILGSFRIKLMRSDENLPDISSAFRRSYHRGRLVHYVGADTDWSQLGNWVRGIVVMRRADRSSLTPEYPQPYPGSCHYRVLTLKKGKSLIFHIYIRKLSLSDVNTTKIRVLLFTIKTLLHIYGFYHVWPV